MMKTAREFIDESCTLFEELRKEYEDISGKIVKGLEELLSSLNESVAFVNGRVKGAKSLKEKIIRKNYHQKYDTPELFINSLADGIGIRIVALLKEDEEKIYDCLVKKATGNSLTYENKEYQEIMDHFYLLRDKQPQEQQNGLPIYRIDFVWEQNDSARMIKGELQIKSLVHLLWGEIEHSLFYKNSNFIISGSYYSTLMKSIYVGLENIDCQIEALKNHMNDKVKNSNEEIHQIAGLLLSQKYKTGLNAIFGCDLDLVEVYKALSEMYFVRATTANSHLDVLRKLQDDIANSREIADVYDLLENGRYVAGHISESNRVLAECINDNVKHEDAFWKSFCAIYISLNDHSGTQEKDYSQWLNEIANSLRGMFRSSMDAIDAFEDEINDLLKECVCAALNDILIGVNKISVFSVMGGRRIIMDSMEDSIRYVQSKMTLYSEDNGFVVPADIVEANKETIQWYLFLQIMYSLKETVSRELIEKINDKIKEINDFELEFDAALRAYGTEVYLEGSMGGEK